MKISEFKKQLENTVELQFSLPNGEKIPSHFHITEMGMITKHFIDCGVSIHEEKKVTFQLWFANDFEHRLTPDKGLKIIDASHKIMGDEDLEIEVEYQMVETIGKFGLDFDNGNFKLTRKETTCLAIDSCGIPIEKVKVKMGEWKEKAISCAPNSGCC
ncbi:DUF6428 family protein [Flavobacterium sp.]|uniref:DUF6428 family protein n=1 Tax=Flavobacterium sp. TaxID=239 RepID=UPI00286CD3DF|nr:DUF6428 family protein [Flavobacterium sp.]